MTVTTSAPTAGSTAGPTGTGAWDEPTGATPRGTVVVLTGRGETPRAYERLGRRLSADAYKVRAVVVDLDDLDATRAVVQDLLDDQALPSPRVLLGSDAGATLAAAWADDLAVDGAVVAGRALPGSTAVLGWEGELEARSACPVHRSRLVDEEVLRPGALGRDLPASWEGPRLSAPVTPTLVIHGTADPVTPVEDAVAPYDGSPQVVVRLVEGGRHDVLNDVSHRSVAATVVLFLESLRLGSDLPAVVRSV